MSPIVEWNQAKVIAEIAGRVAANMERACELVEQDAKQRAPRDTGNLASKIGHEVVAKGNVIEGRVGVLHSKKGEKSAWYGYLHEVGTSKMQAHPFLRPAVFENGDEIVKIIQGE